MKMKCIVMLFILITLIAVGVKASSSERLKVRKPKIKDMDKDHIPNPIDEDIDGDTVPNIIEMQHGTNPYNPYSYLIEDYMLGR